MSLVLPPFRKKSGYPLIKQALELQAALSQYLSRTIQQTGDRKRVVISIWFRKTKPGVTGQGLIDNRSATDQIIVDNGSGGDQIRIITASTTLTSTAVLRDASAWYHLVVAVDTTQATAANRVRAWLNGVALALTGSYPAQHADTTWNFAGTTFDIGRQQSSYYFDGPIAEVIWLDGATVTDATTFGQFDKDGRWFWKKYAGASGVPTLDRVPTMTSATAPSGNVTTNDDSQAPAWHVFNDANDDATGWNTNVVSANPTSKWVAYEFASAKTISSYTIKVSASYAARGPKSWNLAGWTGSAWVTLDTRTGVAGWAGNERRAYTIASPASYIKYRLEVTEVQTTGTTLIIEEIELCETDATGYGLNGFHLDFSDSPFLGKDVSGKTDVLGDIALVTGTAFGGNINASYPEAKAFDGSLVWTGNSCLGTVNANPMWVGKSWGTARHLDGYAVKSPASSAVNFSGNNASSVTIALYGSNALPASATDGTLLHDMGAVINTPSTALVAQQLSGLPVTSYLYHWIVLTSSQGEKTIGEAEFYAYGGNDWLPVNAPVQTLDTPTNVYPRFDPLYNGTFINSTRATLSKAGKRMTPTGSGSSVGEGILSQAYASGKWGFEFTVGAYAYNRIGIVDLKQWINANSANQFGQEAGQWAYRAENGQKGTAGTWSAYGAAWTGNCTIRIEHDADAGTVTFFKDGVSQGVAFTGIFGGYYTVIVDSYPPGWFEIAETPSAATAGFKPLCTANLPKPAIADPGKHFDVVTWTGNSALRTISTECAPGLVWAKARNAARSHHVYDALRGAGNTLFTDATTGGTSRPNCLTAFGPVGFDLGTSSDGGVNLSGDTMVAWAWGGFTALTAQQITDLVTASGATKTPAGMTVNAAAGMSIVKFDGQTAAVVSFPHGLSKTPKLVITKDLTTTNGWICNFPFLGAGHMMLHTTAAWTSSQGIAADAQKVTMGNGYTNTGPMIAYCFTDTEGFSAFGSYVGNGAADGPRIVLPFRPAWVMFKRADAASGSWLIHDDARDPYNVMPKYLLANLANAEGTDATNDCVDFLANGFKCRGTTGGYVNTTGITHVYAAFARYPFGGGSIPPVPAR